MDEDSKLMKVWIFFWKVVALLLALLGVLLLAALQSCLISVVMPSSLPGVLPVTMAIAGIATVGLVVYFAAKSLWGKSEE